MNWDKVTEFYRWLTVFRGVFGEGGFRAFLHVSKCAVIFSLPGVLSISLVETSCLSSDMDQRVQSASVSAIPAFTSQYYINNGILDINARDIILTQYFNMLK